ncbi:MAG: transglutaminase family protein [Eubacteriales bacterium]|nr:transglutaminase family protein [Eubacteriales bacterium]
MRKLHFTYEMQIEYSIDVARCNFTIKCCPQNTARQRLEDVNVQLFPATTYCTGVDGLQNKQIYGVNELPHKIFRFQTDGTAYTGLCDYEEIVNEDYAMIFRHPHGLNQAGVGIMDFYEKHKPDSGLSVYEKAQYFMHLLHAKFSYQPCTTDVDTTAEDAFVQGHGVCQDYAHIFISLMHLSNIPARYVTGLIVGEGASHAWVEVLCDDKWYGFDPTNEKMVVDEHIKIGVGRDAKDCMINRGIMHGGGLHTQIIKVNVKDCL